MKKKRGQPMKKQMLHLLLLCTLVLLPSACIREDIPSQKQGPLVELRMEIKSRATDEGAIQRVRIIVTDAAGAVQFNQLTQLTPGNTSPLIAQAQPGTRHFYTLINEPTALTQTLNVARKGDDIEKLRVAYTPSAANEPLMMYAEQKSVEVKTTDDHQATVTYTDAAGTTYADATTLTLNAVRLMAKVSLTFIKNNPDFTVKNLSIKVLRIPQYAYAGSENEYTLPAPTWNNPAKWSPLSLPQTSTAELNADNTATWDANTHTYSYRVDKERADFADFYLPEYLLPSDKRGEVDCSTVLIVNGTCITPQGREIDANWRIDLMANNFRIDRNTHYKIAARIEGMGSMGIYAEIAPVTEHDIPVNWKPLPGLAIVSDRTADNGKNINVLNDITAYSGILKLVKSNAGGTDTYHNLLFKQGSVVGISDQPGSYTSTEVLYTPLLAEPGYTTATYDDIPASSSGVPATNSLTALLAGTGDPCQLVGVSTSQLTQGKYGNGQWHTATAEEYQHLITNKDATQDAAGWKSFASLLLSPTAHRATDGATTAAATQGSYWSAESKQRFGFTAGQADKAAMDEADVHQALAVRCVRNTIPETKIDVTNKGARYTVGYGGATVEIEVLSNVPQWSAAGTYPITNPTGAFDGKFSVAVPRREVQSNDESTTIAITGTGYDGKNTQRTVTLVQTGYRWGLRIVSHTLPAGRILAAEEQYTATVELTPTDIAQLPTGAQCTLTISAIGMTDIVATSVAFAADTRQATLTFTAPANPRNDLRTLTFTFQANNIPSTTDCKASINIIQEKP